MAVKQSINGRRTGAVITSVLDASSRRCRRTKDYTYRRLEGSYVPRNLKPAVPHSCCSACSDVATWGRGHVPPLKFPHFLDFPRSRENLKSLDNARSYYIESPYFHMYSYFFANCLAIKTLILITTINLRSAVSLPSTDDQLSVRVADPSRAGVVCDCVIYRVRRALITKMRRRIAIFAVSVG